MKNLFSSVVAAIAGLVLIPSVWAAAPIPPDVQAARQKIDAEFERAELKSLSVGLSREGQTVFTYVHGEEPFDAETPLETMSVTKSVTAMLVLQLVTEGKLKLEDPMVKYIPEFPDPEVTVVNMLTHTSGWRNGKGKGLNWKKKSDANLKDFYASMFRELPRETKFQYFSSGYDVLVDLIERVTGAPDIDSYARRRIFGPLGMTHTTLPPHAGQAGMKTTVGDMLLLGNEILDVNRTGKPGKAFDVETVRLMLTPVLNPAFHRTPAFFAKNEKCRGFCQDFIEANSPKAVGHGGASGCYFMVDPGIGTVGVILSQAQPKKAGLHTTPGAYKNIFRAMFAAALAAAPVPVVDLSGDKSQDVVIAAGTEEVYQGHPTTVRTADGRIIAVWCTPHGGHCGPAAETADGGKTWTRIDARFPKGFADHVNCPSVYRLVGPDGKARLWVWSQSKRRETDKSGDDWACRKDVSRAMPSVMSEDEGLTWKELSPMGAKFACVMAFSSIVRLKDGSYLGMFHVGPSGADKPPLRVKQSITKDGGLTWSDPVEVCHIPGKNPCEPYVFRSPKGDELCCLMRENNHTGRSLMMFSRDEGKTWTQAVDTPWALTGDRHQGVQLPDGRLLIVFRDMAPESPTKGSFCGWVGTYDELKSGELGKSYRLKLIHSYGGWDCGYPGIHLLDDGTILATTYIKYWNDARKQSVVSKRFRLPR